MSQPLYQSHENVAGMSDSRKKWDRLAIPKDLTGKRVLDIGCNEGLLSHWCAELGAAEVIGIDANKDCIEYAQQRYATDSVSFRRQKWATLPDGPFDLVLWTSAMHYERDPRTVLRAIEHLLAPAGLLVLECGVERMPGREMVCHSRHSDVQFYPTKDLLELELLGGFCAREVAVPEITLGDPVPRRVYHCTHPSPNVMFIAGESGVGKSNLANSLYPSATKTVRLDKIVSYIARGEFHHGPLQLKIKELFDPADLGRIYSAINSDELRPHFVAWLGEFVAPSDTLVVFEGLISAAAIEDFAAKFPRYRIWVSARVGILSC